MGFIQAIFVFLRAFIMGRAAAAAEILALRQQLAVCRQSIKRPKLRPRDRIFWVMLSCLWPDWRSVLAIVQPETVIRWHRRGFKLYWKWKSRPRVKPGRRPVGREIRSLIQRMSRENPTWGAPRILSELLLLGHKVAEATVAKYMDIEEVLIAPRSPWQNPYCERVIGSIRRDCLNRLIVLNERHLYRILTDYFDYYHNTRAHLSLDRNSPTPREVEPPWQGEVISIRQVGGLHHRHSRAA